MRVAILAFAAGIAWLQWRPELPTAETQAAMAVAGLAVLAAWRRLTVARCALLMMAALLLGAAWAGWRAQQRLADALPDGNEGRDIEVVGVVASLPQSFIISAYALRPSKNR